MATVYFKDFNKWEILPIHSVALKFGNNNAYELEALEASSSFAIRPVLDENDLGASTIVAYALEGSISVIQNNFKAFKGLVQDVQSQNLTMVWIKLYSELQDSNKLIDVNGPPQYGQTPRGALNLETYSITPEIVMSKPSAQIKFNITGYLSAEIISQHYDLLIQQSWS
ncbi:MAG: hypothetical protein KIT33_09805 [Candidatus Kapabacteria bacterium]|nr:hypothetical protein [Ignavibacteriota bacterium]MCW5885251.1 hypothetical protein [Candidatus Kapabacteria bacterium]